MRRCVNCGMEEPSDDTPSVSPSGCQLPQGGSREMSPIMSIPRPLDVVSAGGGFLWVLCGGTYHSTGCLRNRGVTGDFHRPYEALIFLPVTFIEGHSLSHALWACQLPQGGSRGGLAPFIVPLGNRKVAGDFHRPYETQNVYPLPFIGGHSLREGARVGLYHSSCRSETGRLRATFVAPTKGSERFRFYHSTPVSPGSGLRWTGPIPRGFWGRRK